MRFLGNVNWAGVLGCYQASDILYAQLKKDFSGAMPSKLYQYLCSRRFVLYGGGEQAVSTLKKFKNNMVIEPDDVEELVLAIKYIKKLKYDEQGFQENLNTIESEYIREMNVKKILEKWGD